MAARKINPAVISRMKRIKEKREEMQNLLAKIEEEQTELRKERMRQLALKKEGEQFLYGR